MFGTCLEMPEGSPINCREMVRKLWRHRLIIGWGVGQLGGFGRAGVIPPALWATGGLEGPCSLPCFPTEQNPRGGVYPSPLPLPVDPDRWFLGSLGNVLAPQSPSRSDPKIHHFRDRFFKRFLSNFTSQNDSQNQPKSIKIHFKNAPDQKKVNFSKIAPRLHEALSF